jgi:glycosyltransferase involved in cell wall biosynthesis
MTSNPKVSIVLPTYNRLAYLKEAVESVRAQTFADWELIIVDDGSTDETLHWLQSLDESVVTVVRLPHTGNRSIVRNRGIGQARSEWIAFIDSDDLWRPDKLTLQMEQLHANQNRRWSCTGVSFIDAHGAPIPQRAGVPYHAHSGWILEQLLTFNASATMSTLVVHRSLLDEVGGFDESFAHYEDYDLALRLATHSEIAALPGELVVMRQHPERTSDLSKVSELHRVSAAVFRKMARATSIGRIRRICRRQCALQLVARARALSAEGEQRAALASAAEAFREAPFLPATWRALIRLSFQSWFRSR